jgi:hypothetical protein
MVDDIRIMYLDGDNIVFLRFASGATWSIGAFAFAFGGCMKYH